MGTEKKIKHADQKHQDELALILLYDRKSVSIFFFFQQMHSMVGEELNFIPGSNLFGNEIWEGKPHFTETKQLSEYSYIRYPRDN